MISDKENKKWLGALFLILLRAAIVLILALPMGFALWMLSVFITGRIYIFLHEALGLDWFSISNFSFHVIRGDNREFIVLWHIASGIYILYVVLYSLLAFFM